MSSLLSIVIKNVTTLIWHTNVRIISSSVTLDKPLECSGPLLAGTCKRRCIDELNKVLLFLPGRTLYHYLKSVAQFQIKKLLSGDKNINVSVLMIKLILTRCHNSAKWNLAWGGSGWELHASLHRVEMICPQNHNCRNLDETSHIQRKLFFFQRILSLIYKALDICFRKIRKYMIPSLLDKS